MLTAPRAMEDERLAAFLGSVNERLGRVLSLAFDPDAGAPFWLDRQRTLAFDVRAEIREIADLVRLGTLTPADLVTRPPLDFVPRALHARRNEFVLAQTGGTTGDPAWTYYSPSEFEAAFVEPFRVAAQHVGFPRKASWLYAGPSGPHVMGRAARRLAGVLGSPEPFSVDFDPRWARKLPPGSFAQQRYVQHVVDQALAIIRRHAIEVLFTTPPLLAALAPQMEQRERERVLGVHYGGTSLSPQQLAEFQERWFPRAVHLSGFGNTLFGCCLEIDIARGRAPAYFPYGDRLLFRTIGPAGERGRLAFTRLDETMLLVNVLERDAAELVDPPAGAPAGFRLPGVRDVGPRPDDRPVPAGLY